MGLGGDGRRDDEPKLRDRTRRSTRELSPNRPTHDNRRSLSSQLLDMIYRDQKQAPQSVPQELAGERLPPPTVHRDPAQEHFRPPKRDKQKHKVYCSKTDISFEGRNRLDRWNAVGTRMWRFSPSSDSSRFVYRCVWAPRFPFTSSLPVLTVNWLLPGPPKAAPGRQNVYVDGAGENKTRVAVHTVASLAPASDIELPYQCPLTLG